MSDIITTLHPENNTNDNLYPNIKSDNIPNNAVTTSKLATNSVSEDKIQDNAVTTSKLATNSVSEDKIQDNAVTKTKLAINSVTEGKISNGAVTEDKIADYSVTTSKIADGAVTRVNLSEDVNNAIDATVTTSKIEDAAVTENKIRNGAVTRDKLSPIVSDMFDTLNNKIGNLLDLTTETKADLVSAINEVNANSGKHLYRHDILMNVLIDNTYDTYLDTTIYTNNSQPITEETLKDYNISRDVTNGGILCNGKFDNGENSTVLTILYNNQQYYIWLSNDNSLNITSFYSFEDIVTQLF